MDIITITLPPHLLRSFQHTYMRALASLSSSPPQAMAFAKRKSRVITRACWRTTVGVLAFNLYGGRTRETQQWWRRQLRLTGNALSADEAALSPTARKFNSFVAQRLSCSIVGTVGQQIQRGLRALRGSSEGTARTRRGQRTHRHRPALSAADDSTFTAPDRPTFASPAAARPPRRPAGARQVPGPPTPRSPDAPPQGVPKQSRSQPEVDDTVHPSTSPASRCVDPGQPLPHTHGTPPSEPAPPI